MISKRFLFPALLALMLLALPLILVGLATILVYPTLPSLEALTDYRPKIPLRVYSAEGAVIGEFGEERRRLVKINAVPAIMKQAILAAEDERFYQHGGVDYMGVIRAAVSNFTAGGARQGASTITMQVARNFFLSREKTVTRKFNEMLLAFKIERNLSKDQILELYFNQIYLGQRAYGFAAASQVYFGKPLDQINLAEAAMLAGLPKAPSSYNPVANPKRAKLRQLYVLRRMHELRYISDSQWAAAQNAPIPVKRGNQEFGNSEYLAEMVRQVVYPLYQDKTYTHGIKVFTTIRLQDQLAAYRAVRRGMLDYDRRHGYRGPEAFVDLSQGGSDEQLEDALQDINDNDDLIPAVVVSASPKQIEAYCRGGERVDIRGDALTFARRALSDKVPLKQRLRRGSIIRLQKDAKNAWQITQLPQVEAAFVSGDPRTGAIYSLVGGFDFNRSQFNHITQAWRQPGSSFKPFIYSAALEKGFTPATLIEDAPLKFEADETGSEPWEPKNFDNKYDGPMRMRQALTKSKNLVSIRIIQKITPQYAQDYITKFGFEVDKHPAYLTMALGAGMVTPLQMLSGYSIFANGGFRITPYFIDHIEDSHGNVLQKNASPAIAGETAEQVIDVRNAYTMTSMLQDVVKHGTAIRAMQLGRNDLAGKTGTTSDSVDAWFCGFQPTVVGIAWMGFDQPRSLGDNETGGGAALPIWIDYMGKVLKDVPEAIYPLPENMVETTINEQGQPDSNGTRKEYFYQENLPASATPVESAISTLKNLLF
ncbi:MAG: penicillin-binding protein 1A [Gallionella sp.]|jgi:penicillin-binding protein 1A|nr:penicillin-binding protein 1A [Gallionella sp.]